MQVVCKYYEVDCTKRITAQNVPHSTDETRVPNTRHLISLQLNSVFEVFTLCQLQDLPAMVDMS